MLSVFKLIGPALVTPVPMLVVAGHSPRGKLELLERFLRMGFVFAENAFAMGFEQLDEGGDSVVLTRGEVCQRLLICVTPPGTRQRAFSQSMARSTASFLRRQAVVGQQRRIYSDGQPLVHSCF